MRREGAKSLRNPRRRNMKIEAPAENPALPFAAFVIDIARILVLQTTFLPQRRREERARNQIGFLFVVFLASSLSLLRVSASLRFKFFQSRKGIQQGYRHLTVDGRSN
jgi:hypothetical protein